MLIGRSVGIGQVGGGAAAHCTCLFCAFAAVYVKISVAQLCTYAAMVLSSAVFLERLRGLERRRELINPTSAGERSFGFPTRAREDSLGRASSPERVGVMFSACLSGCVEGGVPERTSRLENDCMKVLGTVPRIVWPQPCTSAVARVLATAESYVSLSVDFVDIVSHFLVTPSFGGSTNSRCGRGGAEWV